MIMIPQRLPSSFGSRGTAIHISQYKEGSEWRPTKEARKRIATVQLPIATNAMCSACRYWQKWSKPGGECRRNAPQSVMIHSEIDDTEHIAYWPGTDDSDWCGEWEAKS
jgi:hypothetical protein